MKKLSIEQKREFINANMNVVPQKCIEKFTTLTIDEQYKRIREYMRKVNRKNSPSQRTINESLTDYLKSKKAKLDVVERLMEKCQKWIDETKIRKTQELDVQIAKLMAERNKYNRNTTQIITSNENQNV